MIKINSHKRLTQPVKWHGGKHYLALRILELAPSHIHYVEPFFGGGSVLFSKPRTLVEGHSEVINDLNGDLMNFYSVLQDTKKFAQFSRQVTVVPLAKPMWDKAVRSEPRDKVARAVAFFIKYRQSRQGLGTDFATMSRSRTRRGMNEQVSSWLSAVEGLPEAHERLRRVVIYSEDALTVIQREDSDHTFFYLDPPYLQSTRTVPNAYEKEMSANEHAKLLETLTELRGKFILSGYPSDLYSKFAKANGWKTTQVKIDNKASSAKRKEIKTECLWTNY